MDTHHNTPPSIQSLLRILQDYPQKQEIAPSKEIIEALKECWLFFVAVNQEGMHTGKLERIEKVIWTPPKLTFYIERHGAIAMGSTRAEIQYWELDLENLTAESGTHGFRQIYARDKPLKTQKLAEEIADLILTGKEDPRLKWSSPTWVRIQIGMAIPYTVRRTTADRRKRFSKQITAILGQGGWKLVKGTSPHTYAKTKK